MPVAVTRDRTEWTPLYLEAIDVQACIGCGRCYKACGRDVMEPIPRPYDDDEHEDEMCGGTVMSVAHPGACIGCGACARACAKRAHTHIAA